MSTNWRNLSLLHTYEGYTAFSRNSISETAASRKTWKFVVFGIQGDMQLKSLPFSPTEENITSGNRFGFAMGNNYMGMTTNTDSSVLKENDRDDTSDSSTDDDTNNNAEGARGSRNSNPKKSHGPGRSDLNRLKKRERKARKEQSRQGGQQGSGYSETGTVGNKSDGKNHDEYKEHGNPLQNTSGHQLPRSNAERKPEDIQINANKVQVQKDYHFHVIVAPSLLSDSREDTVIIKIEGISFNKAEQKLKLKRELGDGFAEYEGIVSVPKRSYHATLSYNYCVIVSGKEIQEFVLNHGEKTLNQRQLSHNLLERKGTYHIYDGIVRGHLEKEDKSVVPDFIFKRYKQFKTWRGNSEYQKTLREELRIVMKAYLPELKNATDVQGEEVIRQVRTIYDGLKEYYVILEKLWSNVDDFENHISQQYLEKYLSSTVKWLQESKDNKKSQLYIGVIVIHLKDKYKINLSLTEIAFLFKSLLPKLDNNKKSCPEFEDFKKCFPSQEMYKAVTSRLLSQMQEMMKSSNNPIWLCGIPLLHYLQGKYQPYQDVPDDVNHRNIRPVWWGNDSFENDLNTFKSKGKWNRFVILIVMNSFCPF
ncbi:unnamed protein product [Mytilus edulis]|uniref:Uncharacterized protein n=1 Tax=Mytilus edulis TaxID=6550 RepID=A0A8S3RT39_MYTED|nr:unnamed protein product [Mytilus edulis]